MWDGVHLELGEFTASPRAITGIIRQLVIILMDTMDSLIAITCDAILYCGGFHDHSRSRAQTESV